jgi:hypothetical protein
MNYKNQPTSTNIEAEKDELLNKSYLLLQKIARHRYSIKLLSSAVHALETISNYKPPLSDIRRSKSHATQFELIIPKKNE